VATVFFEAQAVAGLPDAQLVCQRLSAVHGGDLAAVAAQGLDSDFALGFVVIA